MKPIILKPIRPETYYPEPYQASTLSGPNPIILKPIRHETYHPETNQVKPIRPEAYQA
jgi:hypothetical protein